ncbi:hypothetical protein OAG63_01485 [Methylacidiphilales bacterium]|nr:hypothetical protein [Candidatus Methylacidiphilales bacterium]
MKTSFILLASILALNLVPSSLRADAQSEIPANAWEHHAEGVSIAMFLVSRMENGAKKSAIKVYIKNTANTKKYLPGDVNDSALQIFYVDSNGSHVPLRDYTPKIPSVVSMPGMPDSRRYESGEMEVKTIDLTLSELALVEAHPVFCRFHISDQEVGGYKLVESSPRLLTEATDK